MRTLTVIGLALVLSPCVQADSVSENQVAIELKQDAYIPLRADVWDLWANNLLTAQLPANCSYCSSEADSLPLSITAVLRAVWIEGFYNGETFCNRLDCTLANTQSTIAIDDRVSLTITPSSINFGEVPVGQSKTISVALTADPVSTPEPGTLGLVVLGVGLLIARGLKVRL